jgi:hypothetical protein
MAMVGVLAKFEFLEGHETEIGRFFSEGRAIVEGQPPTTGWYAARLGPTTYAAFAVFAGDEDRDSLLAAGGPVLSKTYGHLFAAPPTFDKIDIIEHRSPAPSA